MGLQGITWDNFVSRDLFSTSQVLSKVEHEIGGPSHQYEHHEATTMPVFITYQRGSRPLFTAAKQVLSPPGVEGASLPPSVSQEQDKGKEPMQDEGPSGERETEFVLLHDDETDTDRQMHSLERSSRSNNQRLKPYPLTWRGLSGT